MKKSFKYVLLLLSLFLLSCGDEVVTPKSEAEKIGEEIKSVITNDSIKQIEIYQAGKTVVDEVSPLDLEINGPYLYAVNFNTGGYSLNLNNLIFYEIRRVDSTLVLSF
jgi:hypothetical protein